MMSERLLTPLAVILNKSGFETRTVYSGEAAVEMAEHFRPNMLVVERLGVCSLAFHNVVFLHAEPKA